MKRILTFWAATAAILLAVSCEDETATKPTIEFSRQLYSVCAQSSADIYVRISEAASSDLSIPLIFSSTTAEADEDYTVSSESITIAAGETSGYITLTNNSMMDDDEIRITFASVPSGYDATSKNFTLVTVDQQEALIYSFQYASGDVLDKYIATIKIAGSVTGEEFVATERMAIPAAMYGEGSSLIDASDNGCFIVEEGGNTGTITLTIKDNAFSGMAPLSLGVEETGRFIEGDTPIMDITVKGILSPERLLGKWDFEETIDMDELELWFMEMEDDPDALPTHNKGFSLTFAKDGDKYTVTPSGEGDWMNYFKASTITHTAPVNMTSDGYVLGAYTSDEAQMFVAEVDSPRQQITYFKLSNVNRAFSADTDTPGEGTIAMRLRNNGKLEIYIKDYDTPPFGEMWWDDEDFDTDMFSFASTFTKAE